MVWILDELVRAGELFTEVALEDPLSAVLLAMGAAITAFSMALFGGLSLGAVADLLTPGSDPEQTQRG